MESTDIQTDHFIDHIIKDDLEQRKNQGRSLHASLPGKKEQRNEEQLCSENGVISPLVGIIGSMQALETIKILTNIGESPVGILQLFDAKYSQWRSIKYKKDINCPVCKTP